MADTLTEQDGGLIAKATGAFRAKARELTDEYGRRFRAMEPLYRQPPGQ